MKNLDTRPQILQAFQDSFARLTMARSERSKRRAMARYHDARYRVALLASGQRFDDNMSQEA